MPKFHITQREDYPQRSSCPIGDADLTATPAHWRSRGLDAPGCAKLPRGNSGRLRWLENMYLGLMS